MNLIKAKTALKKYADKEKARILQRFFKTGPGEYGEGDIFTGVTVPNTRKVAKQFQQLSIPDTIKLLKSPVHEERLLSLLILVQKYKTHDPLIKNKIFTLYLKHTSWINNWDLVDLTAHHIVGDFIFHKHNKNVSSKILFNLSTSPLLWNRRIAIIATYYFIRHDRFPETFQISKILLNDKEDLIHKAVGWMLREVGKRNLKEEETFLKKYYRKMPRTMLRYAIEKFEEKKRQDYLKGRIQ